MAEVVLGLCFSMQVNSKSYEWVWLKITGGLDVAQEEHD